MAPILAMRLPLTVWEMPMSPEIHGHPTFQQHRVRSKPLLVEALMTPLLLRSILSQLPLQPAHQHNLAPRPTYQHNLALLASKSANWLINRWYSPAKL